jgi:hypothetical protein
MPAGTFVNNIPPAVFMLIHIVLFIVGAGLASVSFQRGARLLGYGFGLFALAEISYMTYHADWTVFLFAHTVSEVLDALAFITIFAWAMQTVLGGSPSVRRSERRSDTAGVRPTP